ncbi:hypothetical protein [uncultured Helicobacter sp.]|uniref:hypothetical protein n=1 Tax=uncultured Helicobacter sp. TaxID=175537 RepID=UPI00374E29E4
MIEDVLQTQPKAQKLVEKSSTRNSEFEKYLKETTQNLEGLTTKSTTQVAAKPTQVQDTKESKTTPKDSPKLAESTQAKEQISKKAPDATELLAASLTPEALKSQSTATPPQTPKDTPLTQALKATQEQGTKIAQDKQALQAQNTNMQPKIVPDTKDQAPKTLDDVQELAKDKGLNPTKIIASSQTQETQPKPKATPESAKQKIQYEMENIEDRVAVINRGTKKPQNITSKISNIYEEGKAEQSTATLGSMLGLKDLPQQS